MLVNARSNTLEKGGINQTGSELEFPNQSAIKSSAPRDIWGLCWIFTI
jgi:hypothetical protein